MKPVENRRVRGVAAERYPSNLICAHPECSEPVDLRPDGTPTVHHIFPRSQTKSDSYFVEVEYDRLENDETDDRGYSAQTYTEILPHAVGLCGSGTTGHHGDVEEHRAWIKYEDGEYVWYDRIEQEWSATREEFEEGARPPKDDLGEWKKINSLLAKRTAWVRGDPLNPQPGSRDAKPKRKRLKGAARAARKVISVRLPEGVSGEEWDDLLASASDVELSQPDTKFDKTKDVIAVGKLLYTILERFTGRVG